MLSSSRRPVSRVLAGALLAGTLSTGLSALAGAAPALAAAGDVVTMEWSTATSTGSEVSTSAAVSTYDSTSSVSPGGARVGTSRVVQVAPPTGTLFETGRTYPAATSATTDSAQLVVNGAWADRMCPASSGYTAMTGSVTVLDAGYDGTGRLTRLAADYHATCTFLRGTVTGTHEDAGGSVRVASTEPYLGVSSAYTPDTVPVGSSRVGAVTLIGAGAKAVVAGAAELSGARAADYTIAADDCSGSTVTQGSSCTIGIAFAPQPLESSSAPRVATLTVPMPGHVADPVRVRLASTGKEALGGPVDLTTYPTADGVGLAWRDSLGSTQTWRIEHRIGDDWTTLASLPATGAMSFVDHAVSADQHVAYRVTAVGYGFDGPTGTTETTRPATSPTPGADSVVAFGSTDVARASARLRDGTDQATVSVRGDASGRQVVAMAGPTGTGSSPASVTFEMPVVPGPGEYLLASGHAGSAYVSSALVGCSAPTDTVLSVRSVLYDATTRPVLLDASWVARCPDEAIRVEIRLKVADDTTLTTVDPATAGVVTSGGQASTRSLTLTSSGPAPATLGPAAVSGSAAASWDVVDDRCDGRTLAPTDTCQVEVRLSGAGDGDRPALLSVPQHDTAGTLAPVLVPLQGLAATPPGAVTGSAHGTVGAVQLWWNGPSRTGGIAPGGFAVERSEDGGEWVPLAPLSPSSVSYLDRAASPARAATYRIRAVNTVGPGPWTQLGPAGLRPVDHATVVAARAADGHASIYQVADDEPAAPPVLLTRDTSYIEESPAVSPGGTRLVVSRSRDAGTPTETQLDLWSGTLAGPASTQLTSMDGAELDAAFSPDARQVAFTNLTPAQVPSVWVVSAGGGTPRLLRENASAPSWTPDGSQVVVEDDTSLTAPLQTLDVASGAAAPVAGTDGATEPALSRTGDLAYSDGAARIVEITHGSTVGVVRATPAGAAVLVDPAYDAGGKLLYQSFSLQSGRSVTWRVGDASPLTLGLSDLGSPAPLQADLQSPTLTVQGLPAFVAGTADPQLVADDHGETPVPALRPTCQLDSGATQPCTGSLHLAGLLDGPHVLAATVVDEAGHLGTTRVTFVSDRTAPTVSVPTPAAAVGLDPSVFFAWSGADATSGVASYDVEVRTATPTGGFSSSAPPVGWVSGSRATRVSVPLAPGREVCLRVRAVDAAGQRSAYAERCLGQPLDDRALTATAGWRRVAGSALWRTTESSVARPQAALTTATPVWVARVGVLATTCRTCGTVRVLVGAVQVGQVSLRSATTRYRQLLMVPAFSLRSGRVSLRTTSAAPVRIDGLLLRRT